LQCLSLFTNNHLTKPEKHHKMDELDKELQKRVIRR